MRKVLALLALAVASPALAETPHLGQPVSAADMKAWDIDISRDGKWLPPGDGTAAQGAPNVARRIVGEAGPVGF